MKITEGSVFTVPLKDGRFVIGLVARVKPGRGKKCFLGYFFDKVFDVVPTIEVVGTCQPQETILVAICGDLGVHEGYWRVLGSQDAWERNAWQVPAFVRKDVVSGHYTKVVHADDDPSKIVSEIPANEDEAEHLPRDGVWGARAVEAYLSNILNDAVPRAL